MLRLIILIQMTSSKQPYFRYLKRIDKTFSSSNQHN
uniref:Uncharacterized protein n=1 Tax=Rhizophora mucronata TaxID=61149 RepID=A0A2P2QUG6_RHIMU